ncbi:UDP-N-acetylmuramate dehydrogenase [Aliikangiella coralliicola]|uniref:UDP-N-acetylenolpyruvoylglucosamine reductase n=1 Tax=Aliikangiella coralliicola TaxID=2592383 RepID=A0A545U818_9GAMM|nr:UDP-N-acetylmuramate dehydrogenase [Aliikangiella coralliicola]
MQSKTSLKKYNTFNVEACAEHFIKVDSVAQLMEQLPVIQKFSQRLVLGGGSNILFVGDYPGLIIFPQIFGIDIVKEDNDSVRVSVGASENWHQFVLNMTKKGWFGLENLALIPGTVGASPVQNIGAYGVEVKQLIYRVEYVDLDTGELKTLNNEECQFAYRDSLFKRAGQGRFLVTRVEFDLQKHPQLHLSYQPLAEFFNGKSGVSPQNVLDRVCEIRQAKLPDPEQIPNAGSFFKNPVVSHSEFSQIKEKFPKVVSYPTDNGIKLAAGWLIDKAGYRGMRQGNVGVHSAQALVLVNYSESNGAKLWQLAEKIQADIYQLYGVSLEPEVRVEGELNDI